MGNILRAFKEDRQYFEDFLVRSVYNSAAIENNTITVDETRSLLIEGTIPNFRRGVSLRELHELVNLNKAWSFILDNHDKEITISLMHTLHKITMSNIDDYAGQFKRTANMVGGMLTTPPEKVSTDILYLLDNLYKGWLYYAKSEDDIITATAEFHIQYEHIHPYPDSNGRTGRLLMNWILLQNNVPPVSIRVEDRSMYFTYLRNKDVKGLFEYIKEQVACERLLINRNGEIAASKEN